MVCKSISAVVSGIDGVVVSVEADVRNGLPGFQMVGALATESKEAKDRVRVAVENSGFLLPPKRITINISPADLKKEGTSFDLPIALAVLSAYGYLPDEELPAVFAAGELSLDGKIKKTKGILPMICAARDAGIKWAICPADNLCETEDLNGISIYGAKSLSEAVAYMTDLTSELAYKKRNGEADYSEHWESETNGRCISDHFSDFGSFFVEEQAEQDEPDRGCIFTGSEAEKNILMLSCAGNHNLLVTGPAGERKNLVRQIGMLLPGLSEKERLDIGKIASVKGWERPRSKTARPFCEIDRDSVSFTDNIIKAHNGVLFIDELTHVSQNNLTYVTDAAANCRVREKGGRTENILPSSFLLVGGKDACPCGAYPDLSKCRCSGKQIVAFGRKIPNDLIAHFDIFADLHPRTFGEIRHRNPEKPLSYYREKVFAARKAQYIRFGSDKMFNGRMNEHDCDRFCILDDSAEEAFEHMFAERSFDSSFYYKCLKVARTIADMRYEDRLTGEDICLAASVCESERRWIDG